MNLLEINSITGELRTNAILDREEVQSIKFAIIAETSYGSAFHEGEIKIIDVNDNAPTFIDGEKKTIAVNAQEFVIGGPIGRVEAIDSDEDLNGRVRYECDSEYVRIDAETGMFSLSPRILANHQFQFTVTARDLGTPSKRSSIQVVVIIENRIQVKQ